LLYIQNKNIIISRQSQREREEKVTKKKTDYEQDYDKKIVNLFLINLKTFNIFFFFLFINLPWIDYLFFFLTQI